MIVPLINRLVRAVLTVGTSAALCLVAGCAASQQSTPPGRAASALPTGAPQAHASHGGAASADLAVTAARDPVRLARQLTFAETILGEGRASPAVLARQALTVQLTCLRLAGRPGWTRSVIEHVAPTQRTAAAGDIAATADLAALAAPTDKLPPWKIIAPAKLTALRADYRAVQAATGVEWAYLAAINLVETDFGRIAGPSGAGAEGPMQFMPATWAAYGHGDVHRPRNAILAAGRFLADHGAPGRMDSAVYSYNPSERYVDAVRRYAARLRADPEALRGYYYRSVTYRLARGWVRLPAGYGTSRTIRPVPLRT